MRTRAAGGVPHEAHERLALTLREIREESNQVSEIGGHPKWSGMWFGIFLACGFFEDSAIVRLVYGTLAQPATAAPPANASDTAVSLSSSCGDQRGSARE